MSIHTYVRIDVPEATAALARPAALRFRFRGELGRRLKAVTGQWLLPVAHANPRMLEMFRERDLHPLANQVPWAGLSGSRYETWLPVKDTPPPASFARNTPLRSQRNQPMQGNQK